ncbi:META domain-containing protein [Methylomonas sp. LL1]|uniref:META domain-containing protein n=1 Tax=Methylomonas sp. LL1 TaxID=2785785 RepID=UPI0018C443F9|nr:META domain-containing protein [Methylomonas sp. LL1]QPK63570.1 META domain-containing protein [Methylomonas sp. LL1]
MNITKFLKYRVVAASMALVLICACGAIYDDAVMTQSSQSAASHPIGNITGIVWKLKRFDDLSSVSGNGSVDDPNRYTLILLPNKFYKAKADCNRMQGSYVLDGKQIKLAPGAATLAECGPESMYAQYLRYLTEAVSFEINEDDRQLKLNLPKGRMMFENGGKITE